MNYQTGQLGGIIEAWNAIRAWDSSKGAQREASAAIAAPYEQARALLQTGAENVLDAQKHAQDRALLIQKVLPFAVVGAGVLILFSPKIIRRIKERKK